MSQNADFRACITTHFPELSQKQKKIARFILDNPYFIAFASASEVAEEVDASAATVVRFCQAIGYDGYTSLQQEVRKSLPTYSTAVQKLERRLTAPHGEKDDILGQVFATDLANIQRTADLVAGSNFQQAVQELGRAHSILVVGAGLSVAPAVFLAHSLKILGFVAQAITSEGIPLAVELANLKADSVLVAIGLWRYVRDTVEALRWARERGAVTISVTDSPVSPLAQLADYSFAVATEGIAHSLSLTAVMSLLNAFVAAVSYEVPDQAVRALRQVDAAYRQGNLLVTE